MENKPATKSKKAATKQPVHTVREGAIWANIFSTQSPDGYQYHYFLIARSWKSTTQGKLGYSDRYFPRNAVDLGRVAKIAAKKCEELDQQLTHIASDEVA